MRKYKVCKLLLCIALLLIVLINNVSSTQKINVTLPALQCRFQDQEYSEPITIQIKGDYINYLFKDDKFVGSISISNYTFTQDTPVLPLTFKGGEQNLDYGSSSSFWKPFGFLICTPNFDKLLIIVKEPIGNINSGWNSSNGLYICAPAKTPEQAKEIANSLSLHSDRFKNIIWH